MHRAPTRRAVLGGLIAAPFVITRAHAWQPLITPKQIEGPFYPTTPPLESDADLTRLAGQTQAAGEVFEVFGRVFDHRGALIPGARVELWQANAAGRYAHPADGEASGPLDPGFQGFGAVEVKADGAYRFRSVMPGTYQAARDWRRPPHLHFKVHAPSGARITTQSYFAGHPLNAADGILQAIEPALRPRVIVDLKKGESGAKAGRLDFYLPAP